MLEFDRVAIRVTDIQTPALPAGPPYPAGPGHHVELTRLGNRVQINIVGDSHRDMVDVLAGPIPSEEINHGGLVDPHGRESDLPGPPLRFALADKAKLAAVPGKRSLNVIDNKNDMVVADDSDAGAHGPNGATGSKPRRSSTHAVSSTARMSSS